MQGFLKKNETQNLFYSNRFIGHFTGAYFCFYILIIPLCVFGDKKMNKSVYLVFSDCYAIDHIAYGAFLVNIEPVTVIYIIAKDRMILRLLYNRPGCYPFTFCIFDKLYRILMADKIKLISHMVVTKFIN